MDNAFSTRAHEIMTSETRMESLLALEKKRRGVSANRLVFVGIANAAKHWWCTQQAVLKSRANELEFFASYLQDRLTYANRLGRILEFPNNDDDLLTVGDDITVDDVDGLFYGHIKSKPVDPSVKTTVVWMVSTDKEGRRVRLINPNLPHAEMADEIEAAKTDGDIVGGLDIDPLERGVAMQQFCAENYARFRWNFRWGNYVLVGVPDGMTFEFAYEFKSTRNRYLLQFLKPVAFAQADLYAYFFKRLKKRVQIYIVEEQCTETFVEPVDISRAESTLNSFSLVESGGPVRPPKPWKCRCCDFRDSCSIATI